MTRRLLFVWLLLGLVACQQAPPLPTALPTAALPAEGGAATAAATELPPTRDLATGTPLPTATATATPAVPPTVTPTPVVAPILSITSPPAAGQLPLGGEVEVSGYGYFSPGTTVRVGLTSFTGWNLGSAEATVGQNGWRATLELPTAVSGAATVRAIIVTDDGSVLAEDSVPVTLVREGEMEVPYLTLYQPLPGDVAVARHSLLMDGRLQRVQPGRVVLSVRSEDCQTEIAQYNFSVQGSTYFQGYVILPEDYAGPACAVASIGEPGEEGWLAAQVPVQIKALDAPDAVGVVVANPRAGRIVSGGTTLVVNGIAYNAPREGVQIQAALPNGRILDTAGVQPDAYGYWETTVNLPLDLEGEVVLQALLGAENDPQASAVRLFEVVPGQEP